MNLNALYENHLETVCAAVADALEGSKEAGRHFDGVVFHAGTARCYHADDQHMITLSTVQGPRRLHDGDRP